MVHRFPARSIDQSIHKGVSLIETILVVMLLASAMVAGSFMLDGQWLSRRGATDLTNHVHETIAMSRNTAISHQTNVLVRHDNVGGHEVLTIAEEAGPFSPGKKWQVDLGEQLKISGSPTEIWFKATGSADRGLEWKISDGVTAGLVLVTAVDGNVTRKLP
ncbi:MAG: hypothetical protein WBD31_12020 [Rubripirellula sp.]